MKEQESSIYLSSIHKQFAYYKSIGLASIYILNDDQLNWQANEQSNSVAMIVNHISGNMLSRWTNFLTEDGEKTWRNREEEFTEQFFTKEVVITKWNKGWDCLEAALLSIKHSDLGRIIYIRNQGQTLLDAFNRQLCHYPYHIGQIVFISKFLLGENWQSLSIPKGESNAYNDAKFATDKRVEHFTDEILNKKSE